MQEQEAGAVGSGAKRRGGYRSRRGEIPIESAVESYSKLAPGGVLVEGGSCEGGTHRVRTYTVKLAPSNIYFAAAKLVPVSD